MQPFEGAAPWDSLWSASHTTANSVKPTAWGKKPSIEPPASLIQVAKILDGNPKFCTVVAQAVFVCCSGIKVYGDDPLLNGIDKRGDAWFPIKPRVFVGNRPVFLAHAPVNKHQSPQLIGKCIQDRVVRPVRRDQITVFWILDKDPLVFAHHFETTFRLAVYSVSKARATVFVGPPADADHSVHVSLGFRCFVKESQRR